MEDSQKWNSVGTDPFLIFFNTLGLLPATIRAELTVSWGWKSGGGGVFCTADEGSTDLSFWMTMVCIHRLDCVCQFQVQLLFSSMLFHSFFALFGADLFTCWVTSKRQQLHTQELFPCTLNCQLPCHFSPVKNPMWLQKLWQQKENCLVAFFRWCHACPHFTSRDFKDMIVFKKPTNNQPSQRSTSCRQPAVDCRSTASQKCDSLIQRVRFWGEQLSRHAIVREKPLRNQSAFLYQKMKDEL